MARNLSKHDESILSTLLDREAAGGGPKPASSIQLEGQRRVDENYLPHIPAAEVAKLMVIEKAILNQLVSAADTNAATAAATTASPQPGTLAPTPTSPSPSPSPAALQRAIDGLSGLIDTQPAFACAYVDRAQARRMLIMAGAGAGTGSEHGRIDDVLADLHEAIKYARGGERAGRGVGAHDEDKDADTDTGGDAEAGVEEGVEVGVEAEMNAEVEVEVKVNVEAEAEDEDRVEPGCNLSRLQSCVLAAAHTHRGLIYLQAARQSMTMKDGNGDRAVEPSTTAANAEVAGLTPAQLEAMAAADFALGGQYGYGDGIARKAAVQLNPYARACGAIVRNAMMQEFSGAQTGL